MVSISVVIATFNRASLLEATLESLRHQEFRPGDEIIVVDNGSTDRTRDVLARAASRFPVSLHILREPVRGKGPAIVTGIAAASGDVLALTDDDVRLSPDWIASIRCVFSGSTVALVGGRVDPRWDCQPPSWLRFEADGRYTPMSSPLALLHYGETQLLGARTAVGANLAIRRQVVEELGGFRPELARREGSLFGVEDHDLCVRVHAAGYRSEYRPELRVEHWVPAHRMRLAYYWRWFFWSGFANALLHCDDRVGPDGRFHPVTAHFLRRALAGTVATVSHAIRGHVAPAAESMTETAYSLGYLMFRIRTRLQRLRTLTLACVVTAFTLSPALSPAVDMAPRPPAVRSVRDGGRSRFVHRPWLPLETDSAAPLRIAAA